MVGKCDFTGLWAAATTDQGCSGCRMVWMAKRTLRPTVQRRMTGDRLDRCDFQGFTFVQWWQQARQAAGEQGLAGAGRAAEQQVVCACGRDQ
ncbi:hypothetical protein D9M73_218040 [compost metagenome]